MTDIFVALKDKQKNNNYMNVLSAFCQNPKGVSFQTQKASESIVLFLRSHFLTNLSWIIISLILVILPVLGLIFLPKESMNFLYSPTFSRFTTVFILFYYLIILSYIFLSFLNWFYNVFIVTTERVLDIDYSDIVVHNMAETKLSHVEDVRYTQSGFIPSFFDYGNLFVQTAGTEENFEAYSIPKPREATDIITELTGK